MALLICPTARAVALRDSLLQAELPANTTTDIEDATLIAAFQSNGAIRTAHAGDPAYPA